LRIVLCAKEVLDPDAVNAYAVGGRLAIAEDGRTLTAAGIPRLINAYDEQAIEAALRLRDAGVEATIAVVTVDAREATSLRRAAALGADELISIQTAIGDLDGLGVSRVLSAFVEGNGGADLVLCGRQASDDDQGVVPAGIAERLGIPLVTMARDIKLDGNAVTVTRVTPDGDEVVRCPLPAVVTVSSELGTPRYPTAAATLAARRKSTKVISLADLGLDRKDLQPAVRLQSMFIPQVQGNCEFIDGETPRQMALALLRRLRVDGVL
jgi:electron transfer flavoprotein beta subunit